MTKSPATTDDSESIRQTRLGVVYGLTAYFFWGFFPLFFKQLAEVPPLEVLAHRVAWSVVVTSLLLAWTGRWKSVVAALADRRSLTILIGSTLFIAINWVIFIFAVESGQVLQSSLGYFITPLVSVLLGCLFLGESLQRVQVVSLMLALAGVIMQVVSNGHLPWISLVLAVTFALYGLLRKVVAVDALTGLSVETLLLFPFSLGYLIYLAKVGHAAFLTGSGHHDLFLPLAGVVTAIPLLWFAAATKRLRDATVGLMQYITPTMQFFQAVLLFGEPFSPVSLASFACIWCGLIIYSIDAWRSLKCSRLR